MPNVVATDLEPQQKKATFEPSMKYQVAQGSKKVDVEIKEKTIESNGSSFDYKELSSAGSSAVVAVGQRIYGVQLIAFDEETHQATARINGKPAILSIKSELDLLLEKMGGGSSGASGAKNVKAPMPGLIVKLHVSPGDAVEKGQPLLNFEAMKMENQLKSPGSATVKNVLVGPGDKVEKGQVLVELA